MAKYRKKPVVIDAWLFDGKLTNSTEVLTAAAGGGKMWFSGTVEGGDEGKIVIRTLEGEMEASPGDYIIKGIKGEFYPCKPDIFAATYEAA